VPVEFEAHLVEEAVVLAMRARPGASYWWEREKIYGVGDADERERQFSLLNQKGFETLALGAPLYQALAEEPLLASTIERCRVLAAVSRGDEGAELFVASDRAGSERRTSRSIVLRVSPQAFLEPHKFLLFLRHELSHIADMVDPAFGYDPSLPTAEGGPGHLKLILNRYRVLWDTAIDGRLWRSGRGLERAREMRRREFAAAFSMLGERLEEAFEQWFGTSRPAHAEIMEFARNPPASAGLAPHAARTTESCPLCRSPGAVDFPEAGSLPADLVAEIRRDFPAWRAADGICRQCAGLYRSRPLARAAFSLLPKA
jgi:hypothetical protein